MTDTITLFLCVSAAVVLTNGLILFAAAKYFLNGMERVSQAEGERLMAIQERGAEALGRLAGAVEQQKVAPRPPRFPGSQGSNGGGTA